jgi:RNA polymerase sigma-70 factor (ECF subfamily)
MPGEPEVLGLLALMLLTESRRAARTAPDGASCRCPSRTARAGTGRSSRRGRRSCALPAREPAGPYQIQAAINAVHADAPAAADTDWRQVVALYDQLVALDPGPWSR